MKKTVIIAIALGTVAIGLSIIIALTRPFSSDGQAEPETPVEDEYVEMKTLLPDGDFNDAGTTVTILIGEEPVQMTMAEYLIGVVAAEMPAVFELEALKAQAVAARTDTLYHMLVTPHAKHEEADMCSDYSCCQAYQDEEQLYSKWGSEYKTNVKKIIDAVYGTDGVYMYYEEAPILALFHSSSAGVTELPENVWGSPMPYLLSVESPETEEQVPNYVSTVTILMSDFVETVMAAYPEAVLGDDTATWITDIELNESGRVASITIGGVTMTGPQMRSLFGLRSTAATVAVEEDTVVFTTTGYGHGVGMSQYGANAYAMQGKTYRDILASYYTGVEISEEAGAGNDEVF